MGSPEEAAVGLCRRSIRIHLSPFMSRPRLCSNPSPPISWPDWHQVSGGGAINCWAGPNPRGWKTPLVNLQEPHLPHNSREIKTWKSHELIFLYFIGFFHMTNFVSTKCVYVTYQPATKKKKKTCVLHIRTSLYPVWKTQCTCQSRSSPLVIFVWFIIQKEGPCQIMRRANLLSSSFCGHTNIEYMSNPIYK